jgi:hypothetical protein
MRLLTVDLDSDTKLDWGLPNKAKTAVEIGEMRDVKYWLLTNIGKSKNLWSITDHKGREFNWRAVAGAQKSKQQDLMKMPMTIIVSFTSAEDLMLFMLRWPSELLLSD